MPDFEIGKAATAPHDVTTLSTPGSLAKSGAALADGMSIEKSELWDRARNVAYDDAVSRAATSDAIAAPPVAATRTVMAKALAHERRSALAKR